MVAVGFIPRSSIQWDWCRVSDTGARDSTRNRLGPPQELPPSLRDEFAHPPNPWAEAHGYLPLPLRGQNSSKPRADSASRCLHSHPPSECQLMANQPPVGPLRRSRPQQARKPLQGCRHSPSVGKGNDEFVLRERYVHSVRNWLTGYHRIKNGFSDSPELVLRCVCSVLDSP